MVSVCEQSAIIYPYYDNPNDKMSKKNKARVLTLEFRLWRLALSDHVSYSFFCYLNAASFFCKKGAENRKVLRVVPPKLSKLYTVGGTLVNSIL